MPEGIGYGSSTAYLPQRGQSTPERTAEIARQLEDSQESNVAETIQRQANFSSRRAEALERQAEQVSNRVDETRNSLTDKGLGNRLDVSV